ncbi:IclR family transcriptional regulator [Cerasicoccus frondis]|uniref:IclR family transcriptional regulator n=1 Tax=Cerasicoccus frondis TaxID=490090 RepID=UPI002852BF8A|nr:IclR family transcriptional regulator C-terminal domain-containing protein [Cerasicoccus frondis]
MTDSRTVDKGAKHISATLIKGLDALNLISGRETGMTTPELIEALSLPRSNVLRLINSLQLYGLIAQDDRNWKTTENFHSWVLRERCHHYITRYRPVLKDVAAATGELVLLGLHEGNGIVHIDYIESDHVIRVAPAPQTRHNIRVNALGKLALSRRPDLEQQLDNEQLKEELANIRKTGIAWNREESVQGMIAIAHPGFNNTQTEPMIAVAWPIFRFSEENASEAIKAIRSALSKYA